MHRSLLALASATLLAGCAIQTAQASEPAAAVGRHSVTETAATVSEDRYLSTVKALNLGSLLGAADDATLVSSAQNFCANGADTSDLGKAQAVRDTFGMEAAELRVVFRVMAAYYCPEHLAGI